MECLLTPWAGFLQFAITLGDPGANLRKVEGLLAGLAPPADALLVLPELWATGFDYHLAQQLANETPALLAELTELCARHQVHLAGSLLEKEVRACIRNIQNLVRSAGGPHHVVSIDATGI